MKINYLLKYAFAVSLTAFIFSCEDDEDNNESVTPTPEQQSNESPETQTPTTVDTTPVVELLEVLQAKNIPAPQTGGRGEPAGGEFTKYDLDAGAITTDESWDIAFRATTIAINGGVPTGTNDEPKRLGTAGVAIVDEVFANVSDASALSFDQDDSEGFAIPTGSDNGWYNYSGFPTNIISPLPAKTIVVRTTEGNYAKIEFLSYYKDGVFDKDGDGTADQDAEGRFITFNYAINSEIGNTFLATE